jgi:glycosyltransferase involved in cell wall biosynthesis
MMEAMAAGTVPIVADVGDLRDLISEGTTGFVVPQDAIERFSETVVRLMTDEPLWRRCSHAAVAMAEKRSSIQSIAERWRTELGRAIDGTDKGGTCAARAIPQEVKDD